MKTAIIKNHGSKLSLGLAALVPALFMVTFFMSFGDTASTDPEVVEQFARERTRNTYIGLTFVVLTYFSSIGLAIYSMKKDKILSMISLFVCIGYALYFVSGVS